MTITQHIDNGYANCTLEQRLRGRRKGQRPAKRRRSLILSVALAAAFSASIQAASASDWPSGGGNIRNTRNNAAIDVHPKQAEGINEVWNKTLNGDAWTQPTVAFGKVYMSDNAGWIYAWDAVTGAEIWKRQLRDFWNDPAAAEENDPNDAQNEFPNPQPKFAASRTAPAVAYSQHWGVPVVYIGDQAGNPTFTDTPFNGANIYAVNGNTGQLLVMTKVAQNHFTPGNPKPANFLDYTILTGAMAVYNGTLITGVSSLSEASPQCIVEGICTFRGRVMAFNADTLKLKWETYTVPDNPYAGGAVWQSTPSIDTARNQVYVGTGDNYKIPAGTQSCVEQAKKVGRTPEEVGSMIKRCVESAPNWQHNHFDSILALDLNTGRIKWARSTLAYDVWTLGCLGPDWLNRCGPDQDFSQHPMICEMKNQHTGRHEDIVVVGNKGGEMFGLNPDTGNVVWKTDRNKTGDNFNRGLIGGFQWGSACTSRTIVGLAANSYAEEHRLSPRESTRGGSIVGFDPQTGKVEFETAQTEDTALTGALLDTVTQILFGRSISPQYPASNFGAPTCAGRTCFWGSTGVTGFLYATDTQTGKTVWQRQANGSVVWGGAVVQIPGHGIFWYVGSGYSSFTTGKSADRSKPNFWAFHIPEKSDVDTLDESDDQDRGKE
jgi:polyvinyl alcohol dehydrogenase (cytochrome)